MKHVTVLLLLFCAQAALARELPKIDVVYQSPDGSIFDRNCSQFTKAEVKREWIEEAVKRVDARPHLDRRTSPAGNSRLIQAMGLH